MQEEYFETVTDETDEVSHFEEVEIMNDEDVEITTADGETAPYSYANSDDEDDETQEDSYDEEDAEEVEVYEQELVTEVEVEEDSNDEDETEEPEVTSLTTFSEEEQFDLEQKIYDTYTLLRHLSPTGTAIGPQYCFMDYLGGGRVALYNRSNFPNNSVTCRICPAVPEELNYLGYEQINKLMGAYCIIIRDEEETSALQNNGFLDTLPEVPFIYIKNNGDVFMNHRTIEILSEITYRDTVGQEVLSSMSKSAIFTFSSPDTIIYVAGSGLVQDVAKVSPYNGEQLNMDGYTYYLMKNHLKAHLTSRNNS